MTDESKIIKPHNAIRIPGVKVGDILYSMWNEVNGGISRYIVIHVDEDETAIVFCLEPPLNKFVQYAIEGHRTIEDALKSQAEDDIAWHAPRLKVARQALADIKAGKDLQKWVDGFEIDD